MSRLLVPLFILAYVCSAGISLAADDDSAKKLLAKIAELEDKLAKLADENKALAEKNAELQDRINEIEKKSEGTKKSKAVAKEDQARSLKEILVEGSKISGDWKNRDSKGTGDWQLEVTSRDKKDPTKFEGTFTFDIDKVPDGGSKSKVRGKIGSNTLSFETFGEVKLNFNASGKRNNENILDIVWKAGSTTSDLRAVDVK